MRQAATIRKAPAEPIKHEKLGDESAVVEAAPAEDVTLSELDRLSAVVTAVDFECAVVPRGALYLTAAKSVAPNPDYQGACVLCFVMSVAMR